MYLESFNISDIIAEQSREFPWPRGTWSGYATNIFTMGFFHLEILKYGDVIEGMKTLLGAHMYSRSIGTKPSLQ